MTPKKNERDARGHRRSGPAANDGDKSADSTNDQQFAAPADDVEDMDEEQSEDELLAAALFAEDALSDEMLVSTTSAPASMAFIKLTIVTPVVAWT